MDVVRKHGQKVEFYCVLTISNVYERNRIIRLVCVCVFSQFFHVYSLVL